MKKIILMRHGHAASRRSDESDQLRKLDARGIRDVSVVGKKMSTEGILPDYLLHSPAIRALETAKIIAESLERDIELKPELGLYTAVPKTYEKLISSLPDIYKTVMIIAHNPAIEDVVSILTGSKASMGSSDLFEAQLGIEKWKEFTLPGSISTHRFIRAS